MTEMTITRALSQVKICKDLLEKEIERSKFVFLASKKNPDSEQNKEMQKSSKSSFDKINSLMKNLNNLQGAIAKSNLETKVTILGKEVSVSEALIQKQNFEFRKRLFDNILQQYNSVMNKIQTSESKVESETRRFIENLNLDNSSDPDTYNKMFEMGRESAEKEHLLVLLSGFDSKEYLEKEQKQIEEFTLQIDYILSESNSLTKVEVDLS